MSFFKHLFFFFFNQQNVALRRAVLYFAIPAKISLQDLRLLATKRDETQIRWIIRHDFLSCYVTLIITIIICATQVFQLSSLLQVLYKYKPRVLPQQKFLPTISLAQCTPINIMSHRKKRKRQRKFECILTEGSKIHLHHFVLILQLEITPNYQKSPLAVYLY